MYFIFTSPAGTFVSKLWPTLVSVILKVTMWGNSLTVFFASDIFVWPAIHDIMHINPCLSQVNRLITALLECMQGRVDFSGLCIIGV